MGEIKVWRRGGGSRPRISAGSTRTAISITRGRADDVIISAGWTMSAVEIEDILLASTPTSCEAAVIGVPDPVRGQVVKAFIVSRRAGDDAFARELQEFTRERLSQHEYPRQVAFVARAAKTPAGKVNRKVLRDASKQRLSRPVHDPAERYDMTSSEARFPKITDQALDDLRRRIGVPDRRHGRAVVPRGDARQHPPLRPRHRRRQPAVVRSRLRREDAATAASSRRRASCSPASRIISGYVGGLPGVHAMWAGADWTWHRRCGATTRSRPRRHLKDLIEHETRFAGRAIQQIYHVEFFNQRGELVAEADSWCFRTDRDPAREHGTKYTEVKARAARRYTEAELDESPSSTPQEEVRGATPRYWEDVTVGERLPAHGQGADDGHRLHRLRPGLGRPLHPRQQARLEADRTATRASASRTASASPTAPSACTGRRSSRRMVGAPGAYDYGPERCSWLTHHLTNWMGDDGFLRQAPLQDPPAQPGGRPAVHRRHGGAQVRRGRPAPRRDRAGGAQPGRRAVGGRHRHVELPSRDGVSARQIRRRRIH